MQGNVNLPGQAVVESLLCLSFQRQKCEDRIIIALIKSVLILSYIIYFPILIKFILFSDSLSEAMVPRNCGGNCRYFLWLTSRYLKLTWENNNFQLY